MQTSLERTGRRGRKPNGNGHALLARGQNGGVPGIRQQRRRRSLDEGEEGLVPSEKSPETVHIPHIETKTVAITVGQRGASTLIVNRFGEKARRQMLEQQTHAAKRPKEKREPEKDYQASKYKDGRGRDCVPAGWFRRAIIEAATFLGRQVSMKFLSGAVFIKGPDLVPLRFKKCVMRQDVVRNTNGVADLRFRAEYTDWSVELEIEYEQTLISASQLVSLLDRAGFSIGVGEWRPQKKGEHGRFEVRTRRAEKA